MTVGQTHDQHNRAGRSAERQRIHWVDTTIEIDIRSSEGNV